jgi:hypothetical protein
MDIFVFAGAFTGAALVIFPLLIVRRVRACPYSPARSVVARQAYSPTLHHSTLLYVLSICKRNMHIILSSRH